MIRGIVDEITLHDTALTPEEIVRRQTGYGAAAQELPVLAAEVMNSFLILTWESDRDWTLQSSTTGSNRLNTGVTPQKTGNSYSVFLRLEPGRRLFRLARWEE